MTSQLLDKRGRWDALLRRYYGVSLYDLGMDEAITLLLERKNLMKMEAGIDPDRIDPQEWFNQNTAEVKKVTVGRQS